MSQPSRTYTVSCNFPLEDWMLSLALRSGENTWSKWYMKSQEWRRSPGWKQKSRKAKCNSTLRPKNNGESSHSGVRRTRRSYEHQKRKRWQTEQDRVGEQALEEVELELREDQDGVGARRGMQPRAKQQSWEGSALGSKQSHSFTEWALTRSHSLSCVPLTTFGEWKQKAYSHETSMLVRDWDGTLNWNERVGDAVLLGTLIRKTGSRQQDSGCNHP